MKVRTINRFREKDNFSVIHEVGSEFECTNERGTYLQRLGFVELVIEAPAEEKVAEPETAEVNPKNKKNKPFVGDKGQNGNKK